MAPTVQADYDAVNSQPAGQGPASTMESPPSQRALGECAGYYRELLRFLTAKLRCPHEAADVILEVFARLLALDNPDVIRQPLGVSLSHRPQSCARLTKRPTRESLHELQFLAGNFGRHEGRFDFGSKPNDSDVLSFRLTALFRESGTQLDQVPNDRIYIAPAVTWQAAAQTQIMFSAHFQKSARPGSPWVG